MNIATAFIEMGRYQDAFNQLSYVNPSSFVKGFQAVNNKAIYFNNLALIYIGIGDLQSAENVLVEMKKAIDDPKFQKMEKEKNCFLDLYTSKKMLIQIEKGNFEGAEQIFLMMLEKAKTNLQQVSASFHLARVYMNKGETEKAKRYLDFVIQYGGDMMYKSEALKMI